MSYLYYIKNRQNIDLNTFIDIYRDDSLSQESAISSGLKYFKETINKLIKLFKDLYDKVKNVVLTWLRSKSIKKNIIRIKQIIDIGYLTDSDISFLIKEFFDQYENPNDKLLYLFDERGEFHNIDDVIKKTEAELNIISDETKLKPNKLPKDNLERISNNVEYKILNINSDAKVPESFSKDIFKYLVNIDTWYNKVNSFYNSKVKPLENELNNLNKELSKIDLDDTTSRNKLNREIARLKIAIKVAFIPSGVVIGFIRLLSYLANKSFDLKYIATKQNPGSSLYHLSDVNNDKMTKMEPRIAGSNSNEFLPKRVSFGEDIIGCCYAIPRHFNQDNIDGKVSDDIVYKYLYVYEGIPDKDTLYLKPELVNYGLPGTMQSIVKEICVVTPIRVKLTMKIKITYKLSEKSWREGRYIKYDVVESF